MIYPSTEFGDRELRQRRFVCPGKRNRNYSPGNNFLDPFSVRSVDRAQTARYTGDDYIDRFRYVYAARDRYKRVGDQPETCSSECFSKFATKPTGQIRSRAPKRTARLNARDSIR